MRPFPSRRDKIVVAIFILTAAAAVSRVSAAQVPAGFSESQVAVGLTRPISMAFAPDGRLFVCEQDGQLRVIKKGLLMKKPFLTLTNLDSPASNPASERGLLSVAFDPNFSANGYVYVFYTAKTPTVHNRVSRFTAKGDAAARGSEKVILELETQDPDLRPGPGQGGAMRFGLDGKLYIAVGVGTYDSYPGTYDAQNLSSYWGKMLRINPDGSAPSDNPFVGRPDARPAVWALGLRVPFTFAVQPGTGRLFINDVNGHSPVDSSIPELEEINEGVVGANYGWAYGGDASADPSYTRPVYSYAHGDGPAAGCAITGGAFYNPRSRQYPAGYLGDYFFADYCGGWINRLEADGTVTTFASGLPAPVSLEVGAEGSLYYLARGTGSVHKICYGPC